MFLKAVPGWMVTRYTHNNVTRLTLRPNSSSSPGEALRWVALFAGTTCCVGLAWAFAGVWLILPFAGIEAALVSYFIVRVNQCSRDSHLLIMGPAQVHITVSDREGARSMTLSRSDARLLVALDCAPDQEVLRVCDRQHWLEIGQFLTTQDRRQFIGHVKTLGLPVQSFDASRLKI